MSQLEIESLNKEELDKLLKSYDPNKIPVNIKLA